MGKKKVKYVLGIYEITYVSNGFKQIKTLITEEHYRIFLKPIESAISTLEDDNRGKPTEQSILLKESLSLIFGDYKNFFTEMSPLGKSIKTGILELPNIQGGNHKVKWKKLK